MESPREKQRINRAIELAEMFGRKRDWQIFFVAAGEFRTPRRISIRVGHVDNEFVSAEFDTSRRVVHSEEVRSLEWRPGQPLRVQLWCSDQLLTLNRGDYLAASISLDSPFAIVNLLDPNSGVLELKPDASRRDDFFTTPYVRCRVGGLQPDDVRVVKEYLYPGTRWQ